MREVRRVRKGRSGVVVVVGVWGGWGRVCGAVSLAWLCGDALWLRCVLVLFLRGNGGGQ